MNFQNFELGGNFVPEITVHLQLNYINRIIIGGWDGGAANCFSLMMMGACGGGVGGCK